MIPPKQNIIACVKSHNTPVHSQAPTSYQTFIHPFCSSDNDENSLTITFYFKSVNTFLFSNNFSPQSALMRLYSHFPRFVPLLYISSLSQFLLMIHQSVPDILPNHISFDKTLFDRKNRPCFRMTRLYNV